MSVSPRPPCAACSQILTGSGGTPTFSPSASDKSTIKTPANSGPNANFLADSLGVSPLYRQQDSARWQSAAHVYQSSRSHSPIPSASANSTFSSSTEPPQTGTTGGGAATDNSSLERSERAGSFCVTPLQLQQTLAQSNGSCVGSPISLEDIASINRRRHEEAGRLSSEQGGSLELEAIAAVHELSCSVKEINVSEILPRTADLIFVNLKTYEDHPFTLELTLKGWRIASTHTDSMNGDYNRIELHTRYFYHARELLESISPGHAFNFNYCLARRLEQLGEVGAVTAGNSSDFNK